MAYSISAAPLETSKQANKKKGEQQNEKVEQRAINEKVEQQIERYNLITMPWDVKENRLLIFGQYRNI